MAFKNFEHKPLKRLPTEKELLECVTDAQIFSFYLGGLPKRPIKSPLRDDKVPSFSLFYADKHDRIMYKDFATGEVGDSINFVKKLLGYDKFTDTLTRIAIDFGLDQFDLTRSQHTRKQLGSFIKNKDKGTSIRKERIDIKIKVRPWKIKDKVYWEQYGLNRVQLEQCGIFPISHFFMNNYCRKAEKLAYAFVEEKDGLQTFKIYQPLSPEWKWVNNNDFSTWELWTQMPKQGKKLIITSSRKDAAVIKSLFPSHLLSSCSLQSEKVNPKESVINELKSRFDIIYVLYDNDYDKTTNWGKVAAEKICTKFGLTQIEIPSMCTEKDISDYRANHTSQETKDLIKKMILKQ